MVAADDAIRSLNGARGMLQECKGSHVYGCDLEESRLLCMHHDMEETPTKTFALRCSRSQISFASLALGCQTQKKHGEEAVCIQQRPAKVSAENLPSTSIVHRIKSKLALPFAMQTCSSIAGVDTNF